MGITKNWKIPTNFFLCIDYYFVFCVGLEIMQKINLENFVFQFYIVTFSWLSHLHEGQTHFQGVHRGGTFKPVHAMNFCGWSDMRSLQFPIFLNLKCYKRRHFHLSELWLNCEKKKSLLFIFFKWRIRSFDMIQIFWSRILTQYVWQVWVMARRACWGQEVMCWAKWVAPGGGDMRVMDGWTTQISISFSLGKCEWSGYAQRQLSPQIFQRQNFNIGRKRHHPPYGFFCSNLDLRGGNMITVIPCICLLKQAGEYFFTVLG